MEALALRQFERLERDHWWFRGRRKVYLGLLRHLLGCARPHRALDVGAGPGGFAAGLAELCDELVVLDPDPLALSGCRRRAARALRADAARLPFADSSFGLVCLFDVLEHLDDDCLALREARRVLRPGGLLFASVPAWPFLYAQNDRIAHHRRRYTRSALAATTRAAGLEVVRNTHTNVLLFPLIVPAVLAAKGWEAVRGQRASGRTNLSWPLPAAGHELCYRVFAAELPLVRRFDLPAGHSIVLGARRPG